MRSGAGPTILAAMLAIGCGGSQPAEESTPPAHDELATRDAPPSHTRDELTQGSTSVPSHADPDESEPVDEVALPATTTDALGPHLAASEPVYVLFRDDGSLVCQRWDVQTLSEAGGRWVRDFPRVGAPGHLMLTYAYANRTLTFTGPRVDPGDGSRERRGRSCRVDVHAESISGARELAQTDRGPIFLSAGACEAMRNTADARPFDFGRCAEEFVRLEPPR